MLSVAIKEKLKLAISMIEKFLNPPGKPNPNLIKLFIMLRRRVPDLDSIPLYNYVVEYLHNIYNEHIGPFENLDGLNNRILEQWYRYIGFIPREGEQDLQNIPDIVRNLESYVPLEDFLTKGFDDSSNDPRDQYIRQQIPKSDEIENMRNYFEFADDISQLSTELDSVSHSILEESIYEPVHEQTLYIYKKKIYSDKKKMEFEKLKEENKQINEPKVVLEFIPPKQPTLTIHSPAKVDKKLAVQTIRLEHKKNRLKNTIAVSPLEINKLKGNTKEKLLKAKTGNIVSTIRLHVKKKLKELAKNKIGNLPVNNQLNSTELEALPNATNSDNSTALVPNNYTGEPTLIKPTFNATEFEKQIDDMEIEDEDVLDLDEKLNKLEDKKEIPMIEDINEEEETHKFDEDPYTFRDYKKGQYVNKLNRTAIKDLLLENPGAEYPIKHFWNKYDPFHNETQHRMIEQINLYLEKYQNDDPYFEQFINMQKLADMGDWDITELFYEDFSVGGNVWNHVTNTFSYMWQRLVDFSKFVVTGFIESMFKYDWWVKMAVITLSMSGMNFNTLGIFGQGIRAYNHISRFVMPMARFRNYVQNRNSIGHIMLNELRNYQLDRQFNFVFQNPANLIVQNQYVPPLRAFYTPGNLIQHVGNELVNYQPNQLMQDMARVQLQYQQNYFNNIRNYFPQNINNEPIAQRYDNLNFADFMDDNNMAYGEVNVPGVDYRVYGRPLLTSAFLNVGRRLLYRALFGRDAVPPNNLLPNMPFEDREDFN